MSVASSVGQDVGFLGLQRRIIDIFEQNRSAVVRVRAFHVHEGEEARNEFRLGTGFFISREGHVLTNATITRGASRIWIEHNSIQYLAESIGDHSSSNLALLQLLNLPDKFNFLHLTDSSEIPPVGTMVLRISTLYELEPSPFLGLISGRESYFSQNVFPCICIRTTIPGGPGEGGAPLLDLNGKLVGIMMGPIQGVQSSYTFPARAALRVRDDLLFTGKVAQGWIGFEVVAERTIKFGKQIVISKVIEDTPAEREGMLPGDVLISIGDHAIEARDDVKNAVFYTRVGQFVSVLVNRDGSQVEFNIRVEGRPEGYEVAQNMNDEELLPPTVIDPILTPPDEILDEATEESGSLEESVPIDGS